MSKRNRAAIYIDFISSNPRIFVLAKSNNRKRFIEFEEINLALW